MLTAMSLTRIPLILLVLGLFAVYGCTTVSRSPLNPSEGWKFLRSQDPKNLNRKIANDFQQYLIELSPKEKLGLGTIHLFKDRIDQHAVTIEIDLQGTQWTHVLFYNLENNRTKVTKYISGRYRS
jgi:hypothetical protein